MTPRFRMIAGPNGSGKTTLCGRLSSEYSVNFYTMVNADSMFAEATKTRNLRMPVPVDADTFARHVSASSYPPEVLAPFRDGRILLDEDDFRFRTAGAVTTYTVSLIANFAQEAMIEAGQSFSQETVFSHPGKSRPPYRSFPAPTSGTIPAPISAFWLNTKTAGALSTFPRTFPSGFATESLPPLPDPARIPPRNG